MTDIGWRRGQKIDIPGIYPSIPITIYHGDLCVGHSVSHTGLDIIFDQSPKHYYDRSYINPKREEVEPTEAMILGRASHFLFLGERGFTEHFVMRPDKAPDHSGRDWNGNNTACKAWLAQQHRLGLTVIHGKMKEKIMGMSRALKGDALVQGAGVLNGRVEQSIVWRDQETGLWLKARPDVMPNDNDFWDLKVTNNVSDAALERTIGDFGYHRQGALILEGVSRVTGRDMKAMTFSLLFIESDRPYCIEPITIKASALEEGYEDNHAAMRLLARCLKENDWPGPSGRQKDARYMGLKPWTLDQSVYRRRQIEAQLSVARPTPKEQA